MLLRLLRGTVKVVQLIPFFSLIFGATFLVHFSLLDGRTLRLLFFSDTVSDFACTARATSMSERFNRSSRAKQAHTHDTRIAGYTPRTTPFKVYDRMEGMVQHHVEENNRHFGSEGQT